MQGDIQIMSNEPGDLAEGSVDESDADSLAAQFEQLQEENQELRQRLEMLESTVGAEGGLPTADDTSELDDTGTVSGNVEVDGTDSGLPDLSRRSTLVGLAALGALGAGASGSAAAASSGDTLKFGQTYDGSPSSGNGLYLRTDTQNTFLAVNDASANQKYAVQGKAQSPQGRGLVGFATSQSGNTRGLLGRVESPNGTALFGLAASSTGSGATGGRMVTQSSTDGATAVEGEAQGGSGITYGVLGKNSSPDGYGLATPDDALVNSNLEVGGDLQVSGTKNFVQAVDTMAGPKNVHYTAVEAGDALTEHTDIAEMEDGYALIDLPAHFDMVTSDERELAVQVTPHAEEKVHPQVVEKSTRRITVEDFGDGPGDYRFSYTIKGVRDGFENEDVVRDI